MNTTQTGGCLCGGVRYEVSGPLRDVVACHCEQCRRTSGHHVAATNAPLSGFRLTAERSLRWYRASDIARRGFCATCGGNLFWRRDGTEAISIMAGTLDKPTGLRLTRHIFTTFKGDYYAIPADEAQYPGSD
jgi:hypothetical protein